MEISIRRKRTYENPVREHEDWADWKKKLSELLGMDEFDTRGWGECYATGLSPAEAIMCRNTGFKQDIVKAYCGCDKPLQFGADSLMQLRDEDGRFADTILSNCTTKILLKQSDS
jgi:hypothetical protein